MGITNVRRSTAVGLSTILINAATGSAVKIEGHQTGMVIMPAAWTAASLGFKVCDTEDGTYLILRTDAGVPIQITGIVTDAANAYKLPADLFNGPIWVRPWSKHATAGTITDINQDAARTIKLVVA